jgi:hypothetical protein
MPQAETYGGSVHESPVRSRGRALSRRQDVGRPAAYQKPSMLLCFNSLLVEARLNRG